MIENPKKAEIEEYLAKIDWSLRHHGCDHYYFYNHKKKCVGLYLLFPETDALLHLDGKNWETPAYTFYLKDVVMDLLENGGEADCVSFRGKTDKNIFILCPNYDRKKAKKIKC